MIRSAWNNLQAWLNRVPIDDPVERRNAPFLQLVLMFFGTFMPLNLYYYLFIVGPAPELSLATAINALTDFAVIASAWIGVRWIRKGRLRHAVMLFLGVLLGSLTLVYMKLGLNGLVIDPTFPVLSLVLGGLILGRGALWKIFGWLLLMLAAAWLVDLYRAMSAPVARPYQPNFTVHVMMLYLVITAVLDRTIWALRNSLSESARHAQSLATANQLLRQEMAERERAQEQLIHAQKMEAVGRIASGVAHDFDNVLNVVLGFASRRERIADQGTSALVDALEGVDLAARRALSISRKLLNFSRQDLSRPEVFDAVDALRELQPMLRQLFDGETRVRLDATDAALPIYMDRGQFELMTLNIAANARDAMPEGGQFIVTANRASDGPSLEIALRDSGSGMTEAVRMNVFEPFYTTKPMGSGTGLGLAVVRDLVRAAHGSIDAESVPGQGTTFRIRLPLAEAA